MAYVPAGDPRRLAGEPLMTQRLVLMTDDDWAYCRAQPEGGSPFVRRLVGEHRDGEHQGRPCGPLGDAGRAGLGRAVIMPPDLWAFCGAQPGGAVPFIRRLVRGHRAQAHAK